MSVRRAVRRTSSGLSVLMVVGLALTPTTATAADVDAPLWSQVYELTGAQTTLAQVVSTGPENVWAAGTVTGSDNHARPAAFHTEGGTTTTTLLNLDWTLQWGRFLAIDGVADDDLWASGVLYTKATGNARPLLAHWDGVSWRPVALPGGATLTGELVAVAARATDDVWFAGTMDGVSTARVYHWDGTRVRAVGVTIKDPLCFVARVTVTALEVTAEDVWLGLRCGLTTDAREEGSVQRLHNGAWRLAVVLPPSSGILGLADNGAGVVWAVGTESTAGGFQSVVYAGRTTMGRVGTFGNNELYWAIAAQGPQVYLVGQIAVNNTSIATRRSGSTWVDEQVDGDQPLFGATIDPAGTAFAVGPTFGGSFGTPQAGLWRRSA